MFTENKLEAEDEQKRKTFSRPWWGWPLNVLEELEL